MLSWLWAAIFLIMTLSYVVGPSSDGHASCQLAFAADGASLGKDCRVPQAVQQGLLG